jgi:hypothetical protein
MAPGTRIAPEDEDTVALASGDTCCSRSQGALENHESAAASQKPAACSSGRRE